MDQERGVDAVQAALTWEQEAHGLPGWETCRKTTQKAPVGRGRVLCEREVALDYPPQPSAAGAASWHG